MKKQKTKNDDTMMATTLNLPQLKNVELSYCVTNESSLKQKTKFDEIREQIEKLDVDKCLLITKSKNDSMFELKRKLSNIVFGYMRKNVDKKFITGQINANQFEILRTK